jgi:tetratricopeptide (TPR) repeat protein
MATRRERRRQKTRDKKNGQHTPLEVGPSAETRPDLMTEAAQLYESGDIAGAKSMFELIITMEPGHADALFGLGVLEEQANNIAGAKKHYEAAVASEPNHAPSLVNLGDALREEGQFEAAIALLERAASLAPEIPLVHNNLGIALHQGGLIDRAVSVFQKALTLAPDFAEAHCNLGAVFADLDKFQQVINCFERALELDPNFAPAMANLGNAFNGLHRIEEGINALEKAVRIDPNLVYAYAKLAIVYERTNSLQKLEDCIIKAKEIDPNNPEILMINGVILGKNNKLSEGLEEIKRSIKHLYCPVTLCRAYFEAAKLSDSLGKYIQAYEYYEYGNSLIEKRAVELAVDRDQYLVDINRNIDYFKYYKEKNNIKEYFSDINPIFVIGFPSSETTLLGQSLDYHPLIQSINEKPIINVMIEYLCDYLGEYPYCLDKINNSNIGSIREVFFQEISNYIEIDTEKLLVYKMPLNLIHVGLIYKLFPKSKIIFTERHPCDACLSCYMQYFSLNQAMTHFTSLESTAKFYALVMGLWQQYTDVLPIDWHALRYESLVEDFEGTMRALLTFLDLEWDDSVLSYHRHAQNKTILTPSYSQVTQPIYADSKEHWRRYEEHLKPALPVLEPFIQHFGYDAEPTSSTQGS